MATAMVALIIKLCHSLLDVFTPPFIFLVDLLDEKNTCNLFYLMFCSSFPFTKSPPPLIIIIHSHTIHTSHVTTNSTITYLSCFSYIYYTTLNTHIKKIQYHQLQF